MLSRILDGLRSLGTRTDSLEEDIDKFVPYDFSSLAGIEGYQDYVTEVTELLPEATRQQLTRFSGPHRSHRWDAADVKAYLGLALPNQFLQQGEIAIMARMEWEDDCNWSNTYGQLYEHIYWEKCDIKTGMWRVASTVRLPMDLASRLEQPYFDLAIAAIVNGEVTSDERELIERRFKEDIISVQPALSTYGLPSNFAELPLVEVRQYFIAEIASPNKWYRTVNTVVDKLPVLVSAE